MFWAKKQKVQLPLMASAGTAPQQVIIPAVTTVHMPSNIKMKGPSEIPGLVQKHLITEYKMDPDLVTIFKAVIRKNIEGEKRYDIRIFDESESKVKNVNVKNYSTLDEYPSLVIYEGIFDEQLKFVELDERKKVNCDVPLLSESEIQSEIESLVEPGSTVFFYQARGPKYGGPLGSGASLVELNPEFQNKKKKKYIVYAVDVDGMEPVESSKEKLFQFNKSKELAQWIKDAHHKRKY